VAKHGEQFRDNNGTDLAKNRDHPGAQEIFWLLTDYPITPEAHMRKVRALGEESLREAELALPLVKKNRTEAQAAYNWMKAYKLLSDYYERKVLAAISALVYGMGGKRFQADRAKAERLADESVRLYETALNFIWEHIDKKSGQMKGRWGGKSFTLPELIENEKKERERLPQLFGWPAE
jgi:hypothetical protein